MDKPTPTQHGSYLGLSPGIGGPASSIMANPWEEVLGRTVEVDDYLNSPETSEDFRVCFAEEFASPYLPSFVRTISLPGLSQHSRILCFGVFQMLCVGTNFIPRFIREHPDDAFKLYLGLAEGVRVVSDCIEDVLSINDDAWTRVSNYLAAFGLLTAYLAKHLPDPNRSLRLPTLPCGTQIAFQKLSDLVEEETPYPSVDCNLHCYVLDLASEASSLQEFKAGLTPPEGLKLVWWDCEAEEHAAGLGSVGEGEMLACSRCRAVRYCSKGHQKADWKRHKLVCFKSSW